MHYDSKQPWTMHTASNLCDSRHCQLGVQHLASYPHSRHIRCLALTFLMVGTKMAKSGPMASATEHSVSSARSRSSSDGLRVAGGGGMDVQAYVQDRAGSFGCNNQPAGQQLLKA